MFKLHKYESNKNLQGSTKGRHNVARIAGVTFALVGLLATVSLPSYAAPKAVKKPALFYKLPLSFQKSGVIRNGADFTYAPLEYTKKDGVTFTGVDYDLAQAIGKKLGVKIKYSNSDFGTLIPMLQSKRVDIVLSFATVTLARQETVDFIQYSQSGTGILVAKGNPANIRSLDDLCGKNVGLQSGAVQVPIAAEQSVKCVAAGKEAVNVQEMGTDAEVRILLRSGRIDADLLDAPVAAYAVTSAPADYQIVPGANYAARPHGIMLLKGNTKLLKVIQTAVQQIMDDGSYKKILAKYNVPNLGLKVAKINGATS
ncbi:unannotated protein [freshwater metagenome]|uniref:Unannotated protein n=1 Tax=freshwater metagenome TaxID=449393 RepID=A0A6J6YAM0_9ZZZZ